jgi:hypothetical protein
MLKKTIINVCGPSRSGTTMVDLILSNGENAFSCGEVYAWFRPWRTNHFKFKCACGDVNCRYWEELKTLPESEFYKGVFDVHKVDFIIDSSKDEAWLIDSNKWAIDNGYRVINLLLWKDPIDYAFSWFKRGKGLMFWRSQYISYYKRMKQSQLPVYSVNLNEFLSSSDTLEKVCEMANMRFFNNKSEFWKNQSHHLFGSKGTLNQVKKKYNSNISNKFSNAFLIKLDYLNERISKDKKLQEIVEWLNNNDIKNKKDFSCTRQRIIYPLWYFYKKLKQKIRKIIPQKFYIN